MSIILIYYSIIEQILKKEDKACLYKSVVVHKGVHVSVCTPAWVCAFESLMSMYYVCLTKIV